MAKKATSKAARGKAGAVKRKPASAKAASGRKTAKSAPRRKKSAAAGKAKKTPQNAADALIALVESPLVADLLATAVTAAAATMLEHRLRNRRGRETGSLVRAVGAATAAAVGKQLASEFEEMRKAAEAAKGGKST